MAITLHPMLGSTIIYSPDRRGYIAWSITPKRKSKIPTDKANHRIAGNPFEIP
jgi:hypothetical protein